MKKLSFGRGFRRLPYVLALLAVCSGANAAIEYQAVDLPDVVISEDLWEYRYTVTGTFEQFAGFIVLFDAALFANLQDPPPEVNADWSVSTTQPIPALLADGIYSATANKDSPSLADPFKVQFVRLTDAAPGGQSYELLDAGFNVVGTGQTSQPVPIPEPETWALLALGFAALGLQRSKRRARN